MNEGYVAVSFFFILSGYLISYNYKEPLLASRLSVKKFYLARLSRVYPVHLLTLLLVFPVSLSELVTGRVPWEIKLLLNVSLLHSLIPKSNYFFSFNWPSWSLSAELLFYAVFPLLIFNCFKKPRLLQVNLLICLAIGIGLFILMKLLKENPHHLLFCVSPIFRMLDFILGILLFDIFTLVKSRSFSRKTATILEIGTLTLLGIFINFSSFVSPVYRYSVFYWAPVILIILVFSFQKGHISRLLSRPGLVGLGQLSFSFYLVHQPVIRYSLQYNWLGFIPSKVIYFTVVLLLSLLLSFLIFRYVEKPINLFMKKRLASLQ